MLRGIFTYLLLTTILVHSLSQIVIFADYVLHTKYITENFCINKEKPKMKCNGKCHLAKELKHDEEKKSKGTIECSEIIMICTNEVVQVVEGKALRALSNEICFNYNRTILDDQVGSVFHPPTFFS